MEYRRLGRSGLKVSALSLGSWVTFGPQLGTDAATKCIALAHEAGVNFFDNAEAYASGQSEVIMGQAFRDLGLDRGSFVVSTKLFWGLSETVNLHHTLNRKYLLQAIDGSLERFGLDFVDLLFCHRGDPETPIEEVVETMHDIVTSGRAHYWGTSEWSAMEIAAAFEIAEREHLRKPVMEQPEYSLLQRERVEREYARLYERYGLGLTTWSPLASGLLTGKYRDGIPDGSRLSLPGYEWLRNRLNDDQLTQAISKFSGIADELGGTPAQLAIAWCLKNPRVSSVITGASRPEQVQENLAALELLAELDEEVTTRIEDCFSR